LSDSLVKAGVSIVLLPNPQVIYSERNVFGNYPLKADRLFSIAKNIKGVGGKEMSPTLGGEQRLAIRYN